MLESKWGLKIFCLNISDLFYLSVNNVFGNIFNNDNQNSSKTIEDVPVEILYNTKIYMLLNHQILLMLLFQDHNQSYWKESSDDIKVTVNLSNAKSGNYKEDYIVKGLSNDISYNVKPKHAYISPWRIKILKQCMFSLIFHKTM